MKKTNGKNSEMRDYFESLPLFIRQSIIRSGAEFYSKQDLEEFVDGITNNRQMQ